MKGLLKMMFVAMFLGLAIYGSFGYSSVTGTAMEIDLLPSPTPVAEFDQKSCDRQTQRADQGPRE
ncbi:MAG: hypothetical protein QM785_07705 [Pyrinomonadaceae bacterium]